MMVLLNGYYDAKRMIVKTGMMTTAMTCMTMTQFALLDDSHIISCAVALMIMVTTLLVPVINRSVVWTSRVSSSCPACGCSHHQQQQQPKLC